MATLVQLISRVTDIITDPKIMNADIKGYLNDAVTSIAGGMPSVFSISALTPPLPLLFSIGTVATDTTDAHVDMPATFQRDLVFVSNADGVEIEIYNSMIEYSEDYPLMADTGSVRVAIEKGGVLYYQGKPSVAETLTLHFYRKPVDMSLPTSTPDGIPLHLQDRLLVNYVVSRIYEEIIGNFDKAMVHETLFKRALHELEISIPFDARTFSLTE